MDSLIEVVVTEKKCLKSTRCILIGVKLVCDGRVWMILPSSQHDPALRGQRWWVVVGPRHTMRCMVHHQMVMGGGNYLGR